MPLSPSSEVVRRPHPLEAAIGDTQVLLDVEQGLYFGLNAVAISIWQRLDQPIRVSDLCGSLKAEYEGEEARIEAEVFAFLAQLEAQNLIDVSG
ncbi:PqqD family protein [Ancylobacter rudongensis]|uniref:Coenzyme PQQ synthesis protein D (PqqD) n=1 Tax=Ancylobacter rudongensis TaxID=177413 RepID=A0A1G4QKS1_9HYPH|nr:PqqD family protein [Ancylobacter rudongensis]SCW45233.1 Coenzyme PQQ synthesis protein D (PqqD) [Ancylobacter rudongensis]